MRKATPYRIVFFKASTLGPGERWITMHPGGPDTKGVPVLIREQPDGAARVIGGAGGRLSYLKLRGVKSKADYKETVRAREAEKKALRQQQKARDKESGLDKIKRSQKARVKEQAQEKEKALVERMAKRLGITPDELKFDRSHYETLTAKAQKKAWQDHHRQLLSRIHAAVKQGRDRLLSDQETRLQALGEIPLKTQDPAVLSVEDLDTTRTGNGLGFAPQYKARAKAQGATEADIKAERESALTPEKKEAVDRRRATVDEVKQELARVDDAERPQTQPPEKELSPQEIVELLKDQKALKALRQKTREALKGVDETTTLEPKAYVLDIEPAKTEDIAKDLESDLRTVRTRAFLDAVGESGGDPVLGRHLGTGAYHSINRLSLVSSGSSLVDRSVVDVLGIAGAAQVLARRLRQDLGNEQADTIRLGLERYHIDYADMHAEEILTQARKDLEAAKDIAIPEATTGAELEAALALNGHRQDAINKARHQLGTALGEFEANAALVVALGQKPVESLTVPMGKIGTEAAIQRVRALGLEKEDYSFETLAGQPFLTVTGQGLDKLAMPVDPADIAHVRENIAIMKGERDEADWLPEGFANRPDLAMNIKPGAAPRLAEPFTPGPDLTRSLEDYIGSRTADGDPPADIFADLLSEDLTQSLSEAEKSDYFQRLKALAPVTDAQGKMINAESYQDRFETLADQFVQRRYGMTRSALHRQSVPLDQVSVDAVHRTLAAHPEGVAAFKPIGELTHRDQRTLRAVFSKDLARSGPQVQSLEAELSKLDSKAPPKNVEDMFGRGVNPAWIEWKARRDAKDEELSRATLTWDHYSTIMRGTEHAYAALQDLVRGKVAKEFVDNYNRMRPDAPVKLGRTVLRGNLNYLDAVDPAVREQRLRLSKQRQLIDSLRERVDGRYAPGSVHDKLDAARDAQAAFDQNQMGFFAAEPEPEDATKPLQKDQRHYLGHRLERQITGIVDKIGGNFRPGQPVKIWKASLNGKYINQQRAIKAILHSKRVALALSAGCVAGDTVLRCEKTGVEKTFHEWWISGERPFVKAYDEKNNRFVTSQASAVFVKGHGPFYKVTLDNGKAITVTAAHRFLSVDGWKRLDELSVGQRVRTGFSGHEGELLFSRQLSGAAHLSTRKEQPRLFPIVPSCVPLPSVFVQHSKVYLAAWLNWLYASFLSLLQSILEPCRFVPCADAQSFCQTVPSFLGRYSAYSHLCDEQLLAGSDNVQELFPSLNGVLSHSRRCSQKDGLVDELEHTHAYPGFSRLSKQGLNGQGMNLAVALVSRSVLSNCELLTQLLQTAWQCLLSVLSARHKENTKSCVVSYFSGIQRVEPTNDGIIYDISVPVYENYVAHGIVNHNSGKTAVALGAFTQLHSEGKVKRGLFVVPSSVQGQISGEAIRYLDPSKGYKWHAEPGASREERIAAYKDPDTHFTVVTHQAFRDDLLYMAAQMAATSESDMANRLDSMGPKARREFMKKVMESTGINPEFVTIDEGHNLLNRQGKKNSAMANVIDAFSDNVPYLVTASADPIKNDISEAHSVLQRMDPARYSDRASFMRKYSADVQSSKEALQWEMARHIFSGKVDSGVKSMRQEVPVAMSEDQKKRIADLETAAQQVRKARMQGKVPLEALKQLSPRSFEGLSTVQQQDTAKSLMRSIGVIKDSAIRRIIDDGAKTDKVAELVRERKGKPGIVFSHSIEHVKEVADRLRKEGHRVVTLTGANSAEERRKIREAFHPESGEPSADVLVMSDAGSTGMNLQRASYVIQVDQSDTAMTHSQRNARAVRLGQKNDVELLDLVADHPLEKRARERLLSKYALKDVITSSAERLDDSGLAYYLKQSEAA